MTRRSLALLAPLAVSGLVAATPAPAHAFALDRLTAAAGRQALSLAARARGDEAMSLLLQRWAALGIAPPAPGDWVASVEAELVACEALPGWAEPEHVEELPPVADPRLDAALARVRAMGAVPVEVDISPLLEAARAEVQAAREQGYADGFAEGLDRVKQQMTEQLASLNERRARVLGEAVGRIGDLACAIVARIAPQFDPAQVVPPLVMRAVESAQAEQFLMIRVHPSVRDSVAQGLGAVRQAHPGVGVIELVDDESLDPLSCIVVSEAGEVRAGVSQQIEAIRAALAQASTAGAT